MIERLLQDLHYAGRAFRRTPGFLLLAVTTIAVGVGASAVIFSVVNAVLLGPLPFPRAAELVLVSESDQQTKRLRNAASPANYLDWRTRQHSFTAIAAFTSPTLTLADADHPERVAAAMVTANFFDVLDVQPALGRTLVTADEQPGAPHVAVLSDGLWRQRFAGQADLIGQSVRFNDEPYIVVGVLPPGVEYPRQSKAWVTPHWRVPDDPLAPTQDPSPQRSHGYLSTIARLRPGTTLERARADMDAVASTLEREFPDDNRKVGVTLTSVGDDLVSDVRPTILLLFGAVGLLLLIATANVSGLLIARATARRQEMAIRIALGAGDGRIVAQLLTESILLAVVGGAAGVLLAMWLIGPLVSLSPADLGVAGAITVDRSVLLFSLGLSTIAGLLFGLAPAHQLRHVNVHDDLKQGTRAGGGGGQRRVRAVLVAMEIALSLVLLVGAGLTIRSLLKLVREPAGLQPDHVLTLAVGLPTVRYPGPAQKAEFWERAIGALRRVPGVEIAGAISRLPLVPGNSTRGLTIRGLPPDVKATADYRTASPDYFRAMGIPLLGGRVFEDADREGRPLVAVVSRSAAQRFWPNRDPVGERFAINDPEITVVGIVGDVHAAALDKAPQPTVYVPYRQDPWPSMVFALRTTAGSATLSNALRGAIWQADKDQPIGEVRTMDEQLSSSLTRRRFGVTLLSAFGAVAIAMAAIGLYGVLAFIVAQRRREIGVRMALGARPRDVIGDVLGQGLRLAGLGIVVGLGLAMAATRLLNTLLFGTSPTDAFTYAAVATLLLAVAIAASVVPAVRASRVDPLVALRDE